jgi:hypothetical protein
VSADKAARLKAQLPGAPRGEQVVEDLPAPSTVHPYDHPSYWAAFILIGDPGGPMPEKAGAASGSSSSLWCFVTGLLAGGLLLGVVVVWRRHRHLDKISRSKREIP